mgnify:CR=1 FL=1
MSSFSDFLVIKEKSSGESSSENSSPKALADNPYRQIYSQRIVAFIDILGFRNIVMKSSKFIESTGAVSPEAQESELDARIYNALNIPFSQYQRAFEKEYNLNDAEIAELDVKITTFSDSVILSAPDSPMNFSLLIYIASHVVRGLLINGFLTRGGIAYGEVFHRINRNSVEDKASPIEPVFGPAFIKAYDLESKHAKTARIILCNAMWQKTKLWQENSECKYCLYIKGQIIRDKDGPAKIDTFSHIKLGALSEIKDELYEIKSRLETVLGYYVESPAVFSKLAIFAREFNVEVDRFKDDSVKISEYHLP